MRNHSLPMVTDYTYVRSTRPELQHVQEDLQRQSIKEDQQRTTLTNLPGHREGARPYFLYMYYKIGRAIQQDYPLT